MTQYDPNLDPRRPIDTGDHVDTVETIVTGPGVVTESVERVVVRESNTGWWIAGILGGVVLVAVLWILFARGSAPETDEALLDARLDAAEAQAQRDAALVQGQVAGAQASVDVARANAAAADAQARAAEARAAEPVIIEREVPVPVPAPASTGPAVVSPTAPQN
ncbi:hypothetical protein N0B44_21325 [Roseibacterium beibuensis]|uniref:hypothetical protein n=1 Tax=[Roseibacterium] beibuensis TaxID=1193142 RepID=UPI00217DFF42|nr:hypothetical protein [Roseibacterium beibuensis]MCS6625457.1 hypothetical protein [Roseibacterium beibuensis]